MFQSEDTYFLLVFGFIAMATIAALLIFAWCDHQRRNSKARRRRGRATLQTAFKEQRTKMGDKVEEARRPEPQSEDSSDELNVAQ